MTDTSKEWDYYADSKYIRFTNLMLLIKSNEPEKIMTFSKKGRNTPKK